MSYTLCQWYNLVACGTEQIEVCVLPERKAKGAAWTPCACESCAKNPEATPAEEPKKRTASK